MNTTIPIE